MTLPVSKASSIGRREFLRAAAGGLMSAGFLSAPRAVQAFSAFKLPAPLVEERGNWRLTFEDTFDDPVLFQKDWERLQKGGDGHLTMRYPGNVVIGNGEVDLRLGHQNNPERPFTGGYIRTRHLRQLYGYFECEMRIANEAGVNNAFWLTSDKASEGSVHFELDVAEVKYPNVVQVSARRWRPDKLVLSASYRSNMRLDDTFHRYAMLWTENSFRFFVDDWEIFKAANDFAHTPAMLLLSNAVAPFAGKNDGDVAGASTTIRHVKVFQKQG